MKKLSRIVAIAGSVSVRVVLVSAQPSTTPREPTVLVIDAVIEYFGPPGTPTFEAPADRLVNRLKDFWYVPPDVASGKGHVVAAANCDTFGAIGEVSIVQPSPTKALNTAALNALARLKTTPLALAAYPPNRRRLTVTFYYNEASMPGPVAPPPGWPPQGPFRPDDAVTLPQLVREVKPQYTRLAMQARIQGTVLIEGVVQKDGRVGDAIIIRSLDQTFGLDQEAMNAIKQWQFVPGTRMGEPVAVIVKTELTFKLR